MKRMVMFSIAMLVVSSTAFAANIGGQTQDQVGQGGAGQRHMYGQGGAGQRHENQGGGYNGGGVQHAVPGQNGGGIQPIPASALTPAAQLMGGNSNTWAPKNATPKHIHVAQSIVHEAMSRLHTAMSNVNGAAMNNLHDAMSNLEMAASKLNAAMGMVKRAQSMLTPAQTRLVNDAMTLVNQVVMDPFLINLFPASGMTGNGGGTNTPGFTGGNGGATNTPVMATPLAIFVHGVGAPTGSMTGGTGHGSTQQQGNIGQGDAGRYNYQTMNPAQSNVTNSARSQMTPARARN